MINSISCFCSTRRKRSCLIAVLYRAEVPHLGTCLHVGPGDGRRCGCPWSPVALAAPSQSIPRSGRTQAAAFLPARQEYFILDSQMAEEAHTWSPPGFQPVTSARCEEKASAPFRGCRAGGEGQDRLRKPRRSCVLENAHQGGNCLPVYYTRNV